MITTEGTRDPKSQFIRVVNQLKQRHGTPGNPAATAGVVPIDRRVIPHEIVMTEVQRSPLHRRLPTCLTIDLLTSDAFEVKRDSVSVTLVRSLRPAYLPSTSSL